MRVEAGSDSIARRIASSHARANARTSSRDGQVVDAPLRGTAASSDSGSMPRSNSFSSRASTGGRPSPRRRNAITLKPEGALVEHDRVAQRDRPRVVRRGIDQVEDRARFARDCGGTTRSRRAFHRRP
jgi:hypothetical protein